MLGFIELCTEKRRPKSINRFYPLKEKWLPCIYLLRHRWLEIDLPVRFH
ncbi:hypothetical protein CSC41_1299 [Pseudomonas aeruginosa]|nr:hypothetical protein CSC41_1299 [Pseudomonas aeruginosa]